jgi:pimeloyl-ACP methyl ester carboxylesterase
VVNGALKAMYKDLYRYYHEKGKKGEVRQRFIDAITLHKDKKIIFIAHSMGSIVAYESLLKLSEIDPTIQIEHFITIGSPLGFPHVKYNVYEEFSKTVTPENVRKWSNFSDKRDIVALDTHIRDDYGSNSNNVRVTDDLISNDWEGNAHKSYGYLRTPEFSKVINLTIKGEL